MKKFKVTRVGDRLAVVLYGRTGKPVMQGFVCDTGDIERLQPLFRRYLTVADTAAINAEIRSK